MDRQSQAVLETLAFFDAQRRPLSALEIWFYLPAGLGEIDLRKITGMLAGELADEVETNGALYCLKGSEVLLQERHRNYRVSLMRTRKAKKYIYFLRFLPFVRGVAVSGSQALLNSRDESDIDLFIITAKNRIWLARTLVTLFFQLTGSRRHGSKTRNRFCLNHYLDESARIEQDQNRYTAMLYASFVPAFGLEYFDKFYRENKWLNEYLGNRIVQHDVFFSYRPVRIQRFFEFLLELTLLAPFLNWLSKQYQKSRIEKQDYIFVSDRQLSFHPNSRGQKILARFDARRAEFNRNRLRLRQKGG